MRRGLDALLGSGWTYLGAAALLVLLALVTQIDVELPSRPVGGVEELRALHEDPPNVLFVVVDTLRADRLGAYGYERPTSPVLDELAASGVRFARVMAQSSWTKSSMASLWTATYPARNRILRWEHALPEQAVLPAEVFRERGYRTGGIYRNGWVAANFGFAQGFDNYFRPPPSRQPGRVRKDNPSVRQLAGTDEDVTTAAQEFLRTFANRRFFLYLHYMDVHQYAHDEESARFGTSYSDAYDSSIHWVDRNLGAVVRTLEELDLFPETLVVVASDHGEGFREHGLEGHARTLYREVTEVPLLFALPFRLRPGVVVREPVRNVDVWPTVFDLLGFDGAALGGDGVSLVPLIEAALGAAPAAPPPGSAFAQLERRWAKPPGQTRPLVSLAEGDRKLIYARPPDGGKPALELYDVARDPLEQTDLSAREPETVARLRARIEQYLEGEPSAWGEPRHVELDEMELNQLRALGYVIE